MFYSDCHSGNRIANVFGDVESVFNRLLHPSAARSDIGFCPVWDIVEHSELFDVSLELPGIKPEDVKIEFEDGVLSISGEKSIDRSSEDVKFHRSERINGKFHRQLEFDSAVDVEGIEANFEHGLLQVRVPKSPRAVPRKIEVKTGG